MKIIVCGLKMSGPEHIKSQIEAIIAADNSNIIAGFDLVAEEDYNPRIDDYLE